MLRIRWTGCAECGRALGAIALSLALALSVSCASGQDTESYPPSDLTHLSAADRVLVVSPHPDDETLCCAGLIQRARAAGAQVTVVWLTSGDAFELDAALTEHTVHPGAAGMRTLALRRMQEARAAAHTLGVPLADQFFLGFPDRGLLSLLTDHEYVPYMSSFTQLDRVSYPGTFDPGARYEGVELLRELGSIIDRVQPTYVLAPSPLDAHPDHRAAGDLAQRALGVRARLDCLRYWIVHGGLGWPSPRGLHPQRQLSAPRDAARMEWQSVELTPAQRQGKLNALRVYVTQMFGLERRFLVSFVRRNELFARRPLPASP